MFGETLILSAALLMFGIFLSKLFKIVFVQWAIVSSCAFIGGIVFGCQYAWGHLSLSLNKLLSSNDIVGIMQVQRHDFLNHLQVLSGLAQLRKTDRALEYISETVYEINRERTLTKLLPPEAGLVVLFWYQRLRDMGIDFRMELNTDMSQVACGDDLAVLLSELFTCMLSDTAPRPQEILIRSGRAEETGLELILRARGDLPVQALARPCEQARKMGSTILVEELEGMVWVRVQLPQPTLSLA